MCKEDALISASEIPLPSSWLRVKWDIQASPEMETSFSIPSVNQMSPQGLFCLDSWKFIFPCVNSTTQLKIWLLYFYRTFMWFWIGDFSNGLDFTQLSSPLLFLPMWVIIQLDLQQSHWVGTFPWIWTLLGVWSSHWGYWSYFLYFKPLGGLLYERTVYHQTSSILLSFVLLKPAWIVPYFFWSL